MIDGKKVVVCTPAGRRRYMEVLAKYVLTDSEVDRWDVWVNTTTRDDIDFLNHLAGHSKVRLVRLDDNSPTNNFRIHKFFRHATDHNSVYVRLDDDIVYYEFGSVGRLVRYRVENPKPLIVYGNVLNSACMSFIQQTQYDRIPTEWGVCGYEAMDKVGWFDPKFAVKLHGKFLDRANPKDWYVKDCVINDYTRFSINTISWTGEGISEWIDSLTADEEPVLAHELPKRFGRPNAVCGNTLFSHFAFHSQRDVLDETDTLERYRKMATHNRLAQAVAQIESADLTQLQDYEWLSQVIASVGLFNDGRPIYGKWQEYVAPLHEPALWQHPEELAQFFVYMSGHAPDRILEIGTFYGYLAVLMQAYFSMISSNVVIVTCDDKRWINEVRDTPLFKRVYYQPYSQSRDYTGEDFDLVFIDGDHSYQSVASDYVNLKSCPLVAFHDINDSAVPDVSRLWQELKRTRPSEEFLRSDEQKWMGIGLLK